MHLQETAIEGVWDCESGSSEEVRLDSQCLDHSSPVHARST